MPLPLKGGKAQDIDSGRLRCKATAVPTYSAHESIARASAFTSSTPAFPQGNWPLRGVPSWLQLFVCLSSFRGGCCNAPAAISSASSLCNYACNPQPRLYSRLRRLGRF